uniref:Capping protein inhibiting regulator of actin n=1 Tax=Mus spicilegus TaxID=10103 RepID=A0A8C6HP05_MUSSI
MTVFLSLMGEQKVSRQFKQCHRTTSWAKSKLFSRLSSMFLRQLGKNIKFGQRPSNAIPMKKAGSTDASSEEDFVLTSPMEIVTQQDIVPSDTENKSSDTPSSSSPLNLPEAGSDMEEKVAPVKPSRPKRHLSSAGTIESVNLDAIPLAIARLDNSAARHKLSVKPKNQRVSRKHRWLAQDRQNEPGSFESQSSLDQNGQLGEDKHIWHGEEPEPLESHEEKRLHEEYWRELEAKCKRQKAEAAEKRRQEEQRRQALERRLWEESLRQELLEEEEEGEEEEEVKEEGEEVGLQPRAGKAPPEEGHQSGPEEQRCAEQELGGADDPARLEAEERRREQEEAERQAEKLRQREAERQEEEQRQREAERQEEEATQCEAERQAEEARQREAERQEEEARQHEAERQAEKLRQREAERQEEELRQREEAERQEKLRQRDAESQEEELRQREAERQRAQEEDAKGMLQEEEEEAKRIEELKGKETPEPLVEEGPQSPEGESQPWLTDDADQRSPLQRDLEKPGEQEREDLESAGQREIAEEPRGEGEPAEQSGYLGAHCGGLDGEGKETAQTDSPQPQERQMEGTLAPEENEATAADIDRKVEELRWQEVDERQTMPRPYTFQVSSGSRQILFPKVNLSPVTPAKDASLAPAAQEPPAPRGAASHALPSALSIPHTAILVTGAQLCGPAVNLSQIKDTACKSLLGLSEEKRPMDVPTVESRAGSGKSRPAPESPSNAAALAEWASIRSRILKNSEGDQRGDREPARAGDEPVPRARCDSRGNVRRTPPVNAKFSIMPAWQKFSDSGAETFRQSLDGESGRKKPGLAPSEETAPQPHAAAQQEVSQEPPDTTDGCKFAKDLPSFLVPGLPSPQKAASRTESTTTLDSETTSDVGNPDPAMPGGEEKASPFGIKLRRTNYSLRFHCDQQAEQKKKKRHSSTGDSVDGAIPATGSVSGESEPEATFLKHGPSLPQERKPALSPRKDSAESHSSGHYVAVAQSGLPPASGQTPAPEQDRAVSKMPSMQKPALAPKPASQTPPSSPLSKLSRPHLVELLARRAGKLGDSEPSETAKESSDNQPPSPSLPEELKGQKRDEKDVPEKKPASPPLPASQQERPSLIPETGRKEKPVLQSRHSLDGSKVTEKVETAQPLWITLALQKQKGFREQQATREERKQAREAKQAEKLSKETVSVSLQPGSSRASKTAPVHKPAAPSEEKKPETAVSRLQRREQLKKSNTLPTSVTVEISDSAPSAPLVKEVTKRFSTPDAAPVSTEPAWLALAKRKAKAWSDCPQIIK